MRMRIDLVCGSCVHTCFCLVRVDMAVESEQVKVKVKCSRYRPGVAQRVGRDIALLFHDRGTRRGWVISSTPRPHFTPGKDPVPILQEAGWAPGPVWTGGKSRPHRDLIPDRPARSQSLYRLSYPAHTLSRYRRNSCVFYCISCLLTVLIFDSTVMLIRGTLLFDLCVIALFPRLCTTLL